MGYKILYRITAKIEVIDGETTRFPIAFEETESNISVFDTWIPWEDWVQDNLNEDETLPNHSVNPVCFEGWFTVDDIERVNEMDVELKETI